MRCHNALVLLAALGVAEAFVSTQPSVNRPVAALFAEEGEEVAAPVDEAWPAFEPSGLSMGDVRKTIAKLTTENFQESLDKIEPFLVNEAGSSIYSKSMRRLAREAKELGVELPASFAREAKCTKSRREKQNAFVQIKEEERLAAEAEAAEAAAAAAAAEAEEAATAVEETEEVEAPEPVAA